MRALLAEVDIVSARQITAALAPDDFRIETVRTGEDALELAKLYDFDIVLLALNLPDLDGHEIVRRLRIADNTTPILVLAARDDRQEKIRALIAGADDVMVKPLDALELSARIKAIVRRSRGHATSVIRTGRMAIDLHARTVTIDGKPLPVSPKEYSILELMSLRKGRTLTKEMFLDHLYGGMDEPEQKIVDVFICKLRKKIAKLTGEDTGIQTVWGHGYMLRDEPGAGAGLAEAASPYRGLGETAVDELPPGHDRLGELDALLLCLLPAAAR